MRVPLLVAVEVEPDGKTCKDDDEHGGCYFNSSGACRLFLRPVPGPDADPTRVRPCDWHPVVLRQHSVANADIYDRCRECLAAQAASTVPQVLKMLERATVAAEKLVEGERKNGQ